MSISTNFSIIKTVEARKELLKVLYPHTMANLLAEITVTLGIPPPDDDPGQIKFYVTQVSNTVKEINKTHEQFKQSQLALKFLING